MKAIITWTARHLILFVFLAMGIAAYQFGLVSFVIDGFRGSELSSSAELLERVEELKSESQTTFEKKIRETRNSSEKRQKAALSERKLRLQKVEELLAEEPGLLDRYNPKTIVAREQLRLERLTLKGEISILEDQLDIVSLRSKLDQIVVPTLGAIEAASKRCQDANKRVREFNEKSFPEKWGRNVWEREADRLTRESKQACENAGSLKKRRDQGLRQAAALSKSIGRLSSNAASTETDVRAGIAKYQSDHVEDAIGDVLRKAAIALIAIICMPFVIRTVFYFVLAPIAEHRAEIRISAPGGNGIPIDPLKASGVSVPVNLREGEELLVRQGYLQTSAVNGQKSTRWLLDYHHILSSFAAGLWFLTRIRVTNEITTISATHDPLSELAEIPLPAKCACILHPRSLVAVVQQIGRPIRIRSHWRLFSLNAWLTMQLRYLSFEGPGILILKGGRGIRIEPAQRGRIFGQDQLVGFSADLAYSVIRTETFAPYLFGKESLFKDKVSEGTGVVVIEEAPLAYRNGKGVRGGLEGVFDALLKAFGL